MINFRNLTAALAVTLTVIAAPAFGKNAAQQAGHAARAQAIESVISEDGVSPERAQALRACNAAVASFRDYTWGATQLDLYRSCMTQHGQPE